MAADTRQTLGKVGERLAENYLIAQGYKILIRNYRTKIGELDLIAEDSGDLVFVEVKTRTSELFGAPHEAITRAKQQKIARTALEYMTRNGINERAARFDVVGVMLQKNGTPRIEVLKNAFEMC
ncbi:MAG: YraN family protein [Proteobacteria bacterium]|nr:YraN family protein [Pseudomonadota bacterium]MBU1710994.1 YraN family protein [Pseudomonadota bacterium]